MRRYREIMTETNIQTADETTSRDRDQKEYNRIKIRLSIAGIILDIALISLIAFSGVTGWLMSLISPFTENPYLQFLAFSAILGMALSALGFPMEFYGGYLLEHRFNLSNQSIPRWLLEKGKSTAVGLAVGVPVALAFYFFLKSTGELWWFYFSLFIFFISVFLARVAPVIILPLFYKFRELENGEVKDRITALLSAYHIPIKGIYSFNMSRDTKKANAGFTGIGKSKRIILSDTLIKDFTPDEIAVIFAHEMGHYKRRHIVKNIMQSTIIIFATLYLCGMAYSHTALNLGYGSIDDIAAIPILLFYLTLAGLVMMPLTNFISRRYEVQADSFALDATGDRPAFISSMEKLAKMNLADPDPHKAVEFFLYSHPSIKKRIAFAASYGQ
ncbi:MAG: peptidase [Spirochaetae bacterium HGW-Spirochaetae-1]|jgi:STE24 endopeptidase|nr:MAG: peptidase [Spirochaetae bacterium HGW-Spirochaetae-1]